MNEDSMIVQVTAKSACKLQYVYTMHDDKMYVQLQSVFVRVKIQYLLLRVP